jgi:hypothetical protein
MASTESFRPVFIKMLRSGLQALDLDRIASMAKRVDGRQRSLIVAWLGPEGIQQGLEGLADARKSFLLEARDEAAPEGDESAFREALPEILSALNSELPLDAFRAMVDGLAESDLAEQSDYLGPAGRRALLGSMPADKVRILLDRTSDGVLLQAASQAAELLETVTATLVKRERVSGKLQDEETISIKLREKPKGVYMKWLAGPFKGREMLYDEVRLGARRIRVREGGLLGVVPVTLDEDSPIAKRGTNHTATEVGPRHLVRLVNADYRKAAPRGDIRRINHGIQKLDGRDVYVMESVLPRDRSLGYYCHRMMHYTDFARSIELRSDIYNFDNDLQESFYYRDLVENPSLTDKDFDTTHPAYRLR